MWDPVRMLADAERGGRPPVLFPADPAGALMAATIVVCRAAANAPARRSAARVALRDDRARRPRAGRRAGRGRRRVGQHRPGHPAAGHAVLLVPAGRRLPPPGPPSRRR
ncbi:hypothetical protein HBB16_14880 [Pseudonocardia sp. MCCB 268]|nr:hypothetical protein [Pseudonocardia cytotoxica]